MHNIIGKCFILCLSLISLSFTSTPDFFKYQPRLFDPDTLHGEAIGLGIWNVRSIPGASGDSIKIIDIEHGWELNHEDLPTGIQLIYGVNDPHDRNHGTASLGILVGKDNNSGILGICPNAEVLVASHYDLGEAEYETRIVNAINEARNYLSTGDVLLLEMSFDTLGTKRPIENLPRVRAAIDSAIIDSIIVVEAAGNGDLDVTNYVNGHSKAIMVAACDPVSLTKDDESNYGQRIDVNSWGSGVLTTGFGEFYSGDPFSPNDNYGKYRNTSAASAIIAGMVASIQGIYFAHTNLKLGPNQMRKLLKNSGINHKNGTQSIGYFPTLPAAIEYMNNLYNLNIANFIDIHTDQQDAMGMSLIVYPYIGIISF